MPAACTHDPPLDVRGALYAATREMLCAVPFIDDPVHVLRYLERQPNAEAARLALWLLDESGHDVRAALRGLALWRDEGRQ